MPSHATGTGRSTRQRPETKDCDRRADPSPCCHRVVPQGWRAAVQDGSELRGIAYALVQPGSRGRMELCPSRQQVGLLFHTLPTQHKFSSFFKAAQYQSNPTKAFIFS